MKYTSTFVFLFLTSFAQAQTPGAPGIPPTDPGRPIAFQLPPSQRLAEFLGLSREQVDGIRRNILEHNAWRARKQQRIFQVNGEIADETRKSPLDPLGLGIRYAEVESICREIRERDQYLMKVNVDALTMPQKQRIAVLEEAIKLAPVIQDAQAASLLSGGQPGFAQFVLGPGVTGGTFGGFLGVPAGPAGCVDSPAVVRQPMPLSAEQ
jgi:hypothetical protein